MELTPEEIAEKTHGFWDHYYEYTRDWPAEKVIEEVAKLIREYGEQQRKKVKKEILNDIEELREESGSLKDLRDYIKYGM